MAVVGSPWITGDFMTPNQGTDVHRYARPEFGALPILCGRQKNHARKLEHGGNKLKNNSSKEWPERAEERIVVQLQEVCCYPEGPE